MMWLAGFSRLTAVGLVWSAAKFAILRRTGWPGRTPGWAIQIFWYGVFEATWPGITRRRAGRTGRTSCDQSEVTRHLASFHFCFPKARRSMNEAGSELAFLNFT